MEINSDSFKSKLNCDTQVRAKFKKLSNKRHYKKLKNKLKNKLTTA